MDFNTLERLWASNENRLSDTAEAYVLADTVKTLERRRAAAVRGLWLIGLVLAAWTGAVLRGVAVARIDLGREWSAVLMLGVAWLAFAKAATQYWRHLKAGPDAGTSMPEALRALLADNRARQQRAKVMAVALLVFCAALALAVWQLHDVGKMTTRNAVQGATLFGGGLLLSAIVQAVVHFGFTRPEGERLRRLLQAYENEPAAGNS